MLTKKDKDNILNHVVEKWTKLLYFIGNKIIILSILINSKAYNIVLRVSYIGNTPAFQAGKVGSIPTTRSIMRV